MRRRNGSTKSHFGLLFAVVVIAICAISAYKLLRNKIHFPKQKTATIEIQTPEVEFIEIKAGETNLTQELPAKIVPYKAAEIYSPVDGILVSRLFREGSYVKQGQPLYKVDITTKTVIKAPISGYIGRSSLNDGATVTTNLEKPLVVITQLEQMYAKTTISTSLLDEIKKHKNLISTIAIEGNEYEYQGKIQFSETKIDETNQTAVIYVLFPNPEEKLTQDQSVFIKFHFPVNEQLISIPQNAIEMDSQGAFFAYVLNQNNTISKRKIEVINTTPTDYTTASIENFELIAVNPVIASKISQNTITNPILVSRFDGKIITNNISEIQQKKLNTQIEKTTQENAQSVITPAKVIATETAVVVAQKMAEARSSKDIKNTSIKKNPEKSHKKSSKKQSKKHSKKVEKSKKKSQNK